MIYMRAHGNQSGPTQRPGLAAAICSIPAGFLATVLLWYSGGILALARSMHISERSVLLLGIPLALVTGSIYGRVLNRAANNWRSSWIFGLTYGFLLWLIGPVTMFYWSMERPLAVGIPAIGIFGGHLVFGLVLGVLFPGIHHLLKAKDLQGLEVR